MKTKTYIFVYGTLKKGFYNHKFLKDAKYIGNSFINNYYLVSIKNKKYPGILKGKGIVFGEIYLVDNTLLKKLDILEEIKEKVYNRIKIKSFLINKKRLLNSYMYLYNTKLNTFILNKNKF